MNEELSHLYLKLPEPQQGCMLALRSIILDHNEEISETIKYGAPCFLYKKKIICYLWKDKKTQDPYILVADGKLIDHPALESGDRKRMKILPIDPNIDLPLKIIKEVIQAAIEIKNKRRSNP